MELLNYIVAQDQKTIRRCVSREEAVSAAIAQAKDSGRPVSIIVQYSAGQSEEIIFNPDGTNKNIWKIDPGHSFTPQENQVYVNCGGGQFRCIANMDDGTTYYNGAGASSRIVAEFQNIVSGWTFVAKGIIQFIDGTIEWDHSCNGRFEALS